MYLVHCLYMACLWGCRRLCRNSRTPDSLTIYSPKKYLKLDVGWFHPCIQCGILTSNELSYMILIRRNYEQITINCCRVCRNILHHTRSYESPVYGRRYTEILFSDFNFCTNVFCSTSFDAVPVSR